MKMIDAAEFETNLQRILAEVEETGEPVTITRQGRSVAVVKPDIEKAAASLPPLFGMLKRDGYSFPDPFSPLDDLWDEAFDRKWDEKLV